MDLSLFIYTLLEFNKRFLLDAKTYPLNTNWIELNFTSAEQEEAKRSCVISTFVKSDQVLLTLKWVWLNSEPEILVFICSFDTYLHLLQFKLLKCIQFIDSHSKNLWTICIFISCLKSLFDHYVNCTNWRIKNGKLWMTCQVKTPLSSQKTDDYFNFSFEGGFYLDCSTSGLGSDEPSVVTRVDTKCHSIQWHFKFFCSFSN